MENYTKVVLYAYPFLLTVGKDYEEHIRNRAVLSFGSSMNAEKLVEYIAEEILRKERLEWLKGAVERVLAKLSDAERTLIAIRYFGRKRKIRAYRYTKAAKERENANGRGWSERMYFRHQQRLGNKVSGLLKLEGLTEDVYERDFKDEETFAKIHAFVEAGRDKGISVNEREWLHIKP